MPEAANTLMGFDYGSSKIGVAIGQVITQTATPLTTLRSVKNQPDWQRIAQLIEEWKPDTLIVGLPIQMNGTDAEMAAPARRFARQLNGRFKLPVHMVDEKLTSREAWSRIGGKAIKDVTQIDSMAAKLILETWFSSQQ